MTPSKYVQPELGRHSLSVLLVLLLVSAALFSDYCLGSATRTTPGPVSFTNLNLYSFFLVGLIYGWTAAGSWLLSCIERRYLRWGLQLGLTVVLARILQAMREDEWMRFFSSLGGLVFSQTIIFHLIGMPRWKISRLADRDSPNLKDEPTRQFGIGDILACTTCIAFLLAIMIRYQPSGVGSTSYWLPLIAFLTVAPLSAASMMKAVLGSRRRIEQIAWVLLSIGTTILCAAGLTLAQFLLTDLLKNQSNSPDPWQLAVTIGLAYETLLITFVGLFAALASAGLIGNKHKSSRPA
ncbi:hypothetical protein N9D23_11365 [Rubripirellula sp.]|jgi:hypothetical protein|nr:hypothetical protein [Planctomycetaceae bacterium]MDA9858708.1 hypothetical protein [Rubripirellula sp.]